MNFLLGGPRWDSSLVWASLFLFIYLFFSFIFIFWGGWGCLAWFVLEFSFWPVVMLVWIHSLAALLALDFRHVNLAAFLHQTLRPDLSFLSILHVAALMICICCKAGGKRRLVLLSPPSKASVRAVPGQQDSLRWWNTVSLMPTAAAWAVAGEPLAFQQQQSPSLFQSTGRQWIAGNKYDCVSWVKVMGKIQSEPGGGR